MTKLANGVVSPHFSPVFVARVPRCRAQGISETDEGVVDIYQRVLHLPHQLSVITEHEVTRSLCQPRPNRVEVDVVITWSK